MPTIKFPLHSPPANASKIEAREKIDTLIHETNEVIYRVKSVFPFVLFPDEVIVMRTRVDIIYGLFYKSKEVMSIDMARILDVTLDFDLFFASVDFRLTIGQETPSKIKFLRKDSAIKLRKIVTGLVMAQKSKIDLSDLGIEEIRSKMEEVGKSKTSSL